MPLRSLLLVQIVLLLLANSAKADENSRALTDATRRIQDNATGALSRLVDNDATQQDQIRYDGARTAARIAAEGDRVASGMSREYIVDVNGNRVPAYSPQQIQATRDSYAARASSERDRAKRSAILLHDDYAAREASLEQSAQNLQNQIESPTALRDGVVIQPIGTNLYVRNYQPAPRASDEKYGSKVTPLVAKPEAFPEVRRQQERVKTAVSGRLIKQASNKTGAVTHE